VVSLGGVARDGMLRNMKCGRRSNFLGSFNAPGCRKIASSEVFVIDFYADFAGLKSECCTRFPVRIGATLRPPVRTLIKAGHVRLAVG
jgi:hypothetical protein